MVIGKYVMVMVNKMLWLTPACNPLGNDPIAIVGLFSSRHLELFGVFVHCGV